MKFKISSTALTAALQTTGRVISSKNTLPILDYFLFELKDDILTITASDLETTLITQTKVESVEQEGVIAAPERLMLDLLRQFPEQPLTIEANEESWEIVVSCKSGKYVIPGTSGLSYPELQELGEEKQELTFDAGVLQSGINKTSFATANDELRPVMNGVLIEIEPELVTFVATDAHKLVKYTVEGDYNGVEASYILPKKPVGLLKGMLERVQEPVEMAFDAKNVFFTFDGMQLVCRQIEGNYPNYNAVIPKANPNHVTVDREMLLSAIKRVAVCSNQSTNLIKFEIEQNKIVLTAQDIDYSVSANEEVPCSYEGEFITIGFKSTFLEEILSNLKTKNVLIELADSTRAGVYKPIYDEEQITTTLMLLMPMMINP